MTKHAHLTGCGLLMAASALAVVTAQAEDVKFSTKGGLKMETTDGNFKMQVGGRLMADGAYYDDDNVEHGSGTEFRRARLFASGTVFRDWGFKAQYDFAGDDVSIKDAYISYKGISPLSITVGNFKEPFSLEELTSSKYITFMERSLPVNLAPSRNFGLGIHSHANNVTFAGGVFGEGIDSGGDVDAGWGVTGRLTFAPLAAETQAVHLGVAGSYREPDDTDEVRFRVRPESHITSVRYVDTGTLAEVDDITRAGFEAAAVFGPFSAQGEYILADIGRDAGDVTLDGYYVYGSWFITGESRNYDAADGAFGRVTPRSKYGAWEVGVRFSNLDFSEDIDGGDEDNITLGVNYYANRYIRFMANYVLVDNEGGPFGDDEPNIFQARAQIDF